MENNDDAKAPISTKKKKREFKPAIIHISSDEQINAKLTDDKKLIKIENKVKEMKITKKIAERKIEQKASILFHFNETNTKHYNSFKQEIELNNSISGIKSMISKKYDIKDKIEIQFKEEDKKVIINSEILIANIIEKIRNEGEYCPVNELYVKIVDDKEVNLIDNYEKNEQIENGGVSNVYLIKEKNTSQLYAAKACISINENEMREIEVLKMVNHRGLIKFYCFSLTDFDQNENT